MNDEHQRLKAAIGELAWRWDPIGLGLQARPSAADEYDCVVEVVVPLLARGAPIDEIVTLLTVFIKEDMGFSPGEAGLRSFAEAAASRWSRL